MHELPVTQSILEIALRHAQEHEAGRITDLHIVIGDLATIIDDSVQFYWDIISAGTIAEGAELHFRRIPIQMKCLACSHEYSPEKGELACPSCQSTQVEILAGKEFTLEAIDVDTNGHSQSEDTGVEG